MVPEDTDTEINALLSGQVDMIFPQPAAGTRLSGCTDPNVKFTYRLRHPVREPLDPAEDGPFADPILRQAFVRSVDTQSIIDTIYKPIDPEAKQNVCMVWVPTVGDWCDPSLNEGLYDPDAGRSSSPTTGGPRAATASGPRATRRPPSSGP